MAELTHVVEGLLFVASEPLSLDQLCAAANAPEEPVMRALDALSERHRDGRSGVVLEQVAGGYGLRASAAATEACARLFERAPDRALSQAALETLAIVAYAGPVSRPEIARVRGVSADAAVAGLVERGLIEESGRADTPGAPVLYETTVAFARTFALSDGLASLPPLDDIAGGAPSADGLRDRLIAAAGERSSSVR